MNAHATRSLFVPLPTASPLPIWAAALPPLTYYAALFLLPPLPKTVPKRIRTLASALKFCLAAISAYSFVVLPLHYYYPGSAVLTYQLGLVGWYGAGRVVDVFFLSYPRVPRRIVINTAEAGGPKGQGTGISHPYPSGPNETWSLEPHPSDGLFTFQRAWWALDLMISMRGIGWDFASADVRHDRHPWQPPSSAQLRRAFFKLLPVLVACIYTIHHLHPSHTDRINPSITDLSTPAKVAFVAATGISLYTLFDFGYTLCSAVALPVLADMAHPPSSFASTSSKVSAISGLVGNGAPTEAQKRSTGSRSQAANRRMESLRKPPNRAPGSSDIESDVQTDTEVEDDAAGGHTQPRLPAALQHRMHPQRRRTSSSGDQLALRNVDFFPLLNPAGFTQATTVRRFWSFAWHRLFGRFFGVYGILPFTYAAYWIEDLLQGKLWDEKRMRARREVWPSYHADPIRALERGRADWAKVLGAFTASGIIHAVSERAALGGRIAVPPTNVWLPKGHAKGMGHELHAHSAQRISPIHLLSPMRLVPPVSGGGEFSFFFLNGLAVVIEGAVARYVAAYRKRRNDGKSYDMWYDRPISVAWTLTVLLYTGQLFVEGWIRSGISSELGLILGS